METNNYLLLYNEPVVWRTDLQCPFCYCVFTDPSASFLS